MARRRRTLRLVLGPMALVLVAGVAFLAMGIVMRARHLERAEPAGPQAAAPSEPMPSEDRGRTLYTQHCAACHGDKGDGQGIAARFLYPKPRDFRTGRFRLISSTASLAPSAADVHAVLRRGMPGSSMVAWAHLPDRDLLHLASHVLALRREGARDIARKTFELEGTEPTDAELDEFVKGLTQPGEPLDVPDLASPSKEAVLRGREIFLTKGCAACHGKEGKGDGTERMVNSEGIPERPRDLTRGIFKGSDDLASVYRRIAIGMPGSSMPASRTVLSSTQMADLVHFCLSLSSEEDRRACVMQRQRIKAARTDTIAASPTAEMWDRVQPARLAMTSLWWTPGTRDPALEVWAVHDGRSLALRLRWEDATRNETAYRPEDFVDLLAVQVFGGPPRDEPFLGMGAPSTGLDIWQWRAGWQMPYPASETPLDVYPFEDGLGMTTGTGLPPDFLTARAAGNLHGNYGGALSAAELMAKGPGSLTFRPASAQEVAAQASFEDGEWTVVLVRPLSVPGGLSFAPGNRHSAAFALWDGEAKERGGYKRISIWHDVTLDP